MPIFDYFKSLGRRGAVPILGYPGLVAENVTAEQCLRNPKLHAQVVRSNLERYQPDVALPLLDLTVEAESFGIVSVFKDRDAPQISAHRRIEDIVSSQVTAPNRMCLMVETARIVSNQVEDVPNGSFIIGPFTLAGQLIGVYALLRGLFNNPNPLLALIEACTQRVVDYAIHLEDAGVDFHVMADPTSSLMSPRQFDDFAKLPIARVVKSTNKEMVLHICGQSGHLLKQMVEAGVAAISLDEHVNLKDAVTAVPKNVLIFGNYPPTSVLLKKPDTIGAEVKEMLSTVATAENVVASTGCDIRASAPAENIEAFINTAKVFKPSFRCSYSSGAPLDLHLRR